MPTLTLGEWGKGEGGVELLPARIPIEKLLAEYFEIDLKKIEAEKQEMLTALRRPNEEVEKRR